MMEYVAEKQHKVCFSYQQTRISGKRHVIFVRRRITVEAVTPVLSFCCTVFVFDLFSFLSSFSSPSSSVQWCWERSWPGLCTQKRVTPQNATDGTGTCGGSGACNGSGAWHWWQSLCRPSEIQRTGERGKEAAWSSNKRKKWIFPTRTFMDLQRQPEYILPTLYGLHRLDCKSILCIK